MQEDMTEKDEASRRTQFAIGQAGQGVGDEADECGGLFFFCLDFALCL